MPVYEYLCERCGDFSELRPLSEYDRPRPCPGCARPAPRAVLSPPAISGCSSALRAARRRSEASAERPARGVIDARTAARPHAHPARAGRVAGGRPWMLSH
ncbi:MAG: zinc ribbon domain-containing protein [Myxococcota bacterium]